MTEVRIDIVSNPIILTYKIGDYFHTENEIYILSLVNYNQVALISVLSGHRLANPIPVQHYTQITTKELGIIANGYSWTYIPNVKITI